MVANATPVLFVERIEASLPFFEAIGFVKVMDVPHGDALGFCILNDERIELMLQSYDSLAEDMPQLREAALLRFEEERGVIGGGLAEAWH